MKKFVAFLFCLSLSCSAASIARADWAGTSTTLSGPPQWTRLAASDGSLQTPPVRQIAYADSTAYRQGYRECDLSTGIDCRRKTFLDRLEVYGWLQGGFYANARGNTSDHVVQLDRRGRAEQFMVATSGNSSLLGNVQSTEIMMNQLWLGVKRELDTRRGFDWGFRADFLYGTDAWMAQSYGDASFDYRTHHRDYYAALPELYASLGYKNLSVKVGKFETLLGYERLQAPESFFYSHSNLFYTEPQTHCGVLFEYKFRPHLWFSFGYVQGSDNSFANRFDDHGFLGGVYWRPVAPITVWYTLYVADTGSGRYRNGEDRPGGTVYRHSFITNWKITCRWDYSFQWDLGSRHGHGNVGNSYYYGTAHYLTYKINSRWKAGFRFDQVYGTGWMNASGFSRPSTGNYTGNLYGVTLGLNWTPHYKLNIRPELRFDHAADCRPFDGGARQDQFSAGCALTYHF